MPRYSTDSGVSPAWGKQGGSMGSGDTQTGRGCNGEGDTWRALEIDSMEMGALPTLPQLPPTPSMHPPHTAHSPTDNLWIVELNALHVLGAVGRVPLLGRHLHTGIHSWYSSAGLPLHNAAALQLAISSAIGRLQLAAHCLPQVPQPACAFFGCPSSMWSCKARRTLCPFAWLPA